MRLQAFLYLLMRDHLPTGVVVKLIQDAMKAGSGGATFTSKHLAAIAGNLAERLSSREDQ